MIPLPASAELAANAGTGPEGHRRSSSVDSGASSDATMVACDINSIDVADLGAVDGCHKLVAIEKGLASPPEPSPKRAAGVHDQEAHDAKRGRVSTDTASGAPALTTTNTAGSSTVAAPMLASVITATALAVADPNADALNVPNEASDAGQHEAAPADSASAVAAHDAAAAAAMASSAEQNGVIAAGTLAPASSAIVDLPIVDNHDLAPASASATTGAAAATCESATIDANATSRGDAGSPETPVISRRSHAVPIRVFSIGRTSTPAPAPPAGGSKSAVIVANAASRGGAHCPSTPVVSRLPVPRSRGAAVGGSQRGAFSIGLPCSARSATPPAPATTLAAPLAAAPAPADPPMPATALGHLGRAGSYAPPQNLPARVSALRAISRVVQRGMRALRNVLVALFKGGTESTNGRCSTSPGPPDEDRYWDEGAPIDAMLLGLRKRQRRRIL